MSATPAPAVADASSFLMDGLGPSAGASPMTIRKPPRRIRRTDLETEGGAPVYQEDGYSITVLCQSPATVVFPP